MSAPVVQWICKEMSRLMGFEATDDIAKYILTIESKNDLQDYMYELLDPSVPQNKKFVEQLLRKWSPPERKVDNFIPENVQVYRKADDAGEFKTSSEKNPKGNKKKSKKSTASNGTSSNDHVNSHTVHSEVSPKKTDSLPKKSDSNSGAIRKTKFVPLFSDEGHAKTVARLPGRYSCECLATKHNLVNNCVKCGRIVCQQEGSGPCLFCGNLVCTNEEMEILARGSKKSEKLRQQLMGTNQNETKSLSNILPNQTSKVQEGLEKAKMHKDKLINFDKTSVKRTKVIDDQSDYFSVDSRWNSQKEKELLQKREEEKRAQRFSSRRDRKVTLDFAGRQVLDSNEVVDMYDANDSVIQSVHFNNSADHGNSEPVFTDEDFTDLVNPAIKSEPPQYIESKWASKIPRKPGENNECSKKTSRIQDKEILEMSDEGMCMSMHQPWASLLVQGIKKHEGRTWYTPHRGRLWIAATVKPPQPHEIEQVEHQHRQHYQNPAIKFPKEYPVGCLLGCVDVADCLDQDEYLQQYPNGESGSPYVFICESPHELLVKFPMKGKHKIYKLDNHIHQGAKKGIRPTAQ